MLKVAQDLLHEWYPVLISKKVDKNSLPPPPGPPNRERLGDKTVYLRIPIDSYGSFPKLGVVGSNTSDCIGKSSTSG